MSGYIFLTQYDDTITLEFRESIPRNSYPVLLMVHTKDLQKAKNELPLIMGQHFQKIVDSYKGSPSDMMRVLADYISQPALENQLPEDWHTFSFC